MEPVERNPEFRKLALERLSRDKNKPIIIVCNRGGELTRTYKNYKTGEVLPLTGDQMHMPMKYTPSLKAAYELYKLGFTQLYILEGGLNEWKARGLPWETSAFGYPEVCEGDVCVPAW